MVMKFQNVDIFTKFIQFLTCHLLSPAAWKALIPHIILPKASWTYFIPHLKQVTSHFTNDQQMPSMKSYLNYCICAIMACFQQTLHLHLCKTLLGARGEMTLALRNVKEFNFDKHFLIFFLNKVTQNFFWGTYRI